ncbi:nuclease-related domain-containing protein [Sutcliffiella horikoshii]|uniref:nuclease-related domain-containing protein n=1 Tax=Sutcliffiella horikoshii TaxID=79883 RepID=UPI001F305F56|nr:nuclease-related domain-containing protein [Sutcliffiella horikoshii]MCG1022777.1 NERD domain-containing protein [Sutcliffiella horikoshii]
MIVLKEREYSMKIQVLQALIRRLRPNHPSLPIIKKDLGMAMAGYRGEESIDYYLGILPEMEHDIIVFHDLRLPYNNKYFQLDTLLISPTFYLILEVKNMIGILQFDPAFQQLIQIINEDGNEKRIPHRDPIQQVNIQLSQFKSWLKIAKLPYLPCECLVIMANANSELRALSHPNIVQKFVTRNTAISDRIVAYITEYGIGEWDTKEFKKIKNKILKNNEPSLFTDLLNKYAIKRSDILNGVFCKSCDTLSMKRRRGCWVCVECNFKCSEAHLEALKDYKLLICSTITNKSLREFLGIKCESTALRLLTSANLAYFGSTRNRRYIL